MRRFSASTAFVLAFAAAKSASASPAACPLSRAPVLAYAPSTPGLYRCAADEDGDGLDDGVEREIAACVAPILAFDSAEPARLPDEPFVLYDMHRIPGSITHDGDVQRLRVSFAFLFTRDGGFARDSFLCSGVGRDAHHGDTEQAHLDVTIERRVDGWCAFVSNAHGVQSNGATAPDVSFSGSHPVLYPSAGKHHLHHDAGAHVHGVCEDDARGDGAVVTFDAADLHPTPLFEKGEKTRAWYSGAPHEVVFRGDGGIDHERWENACLAASGLPSPSGYETAFDTTSRLFEARFPGELIEGLTFCGGIGCDAHASEVSPVWMTLRGGMYFEGLADVDEDGASELSAKLADGRTFVAADHCPSVAGPYAGCACRKVDLDVAMILKAFSPPIERAWERVIVGLFDDRGAMRMPASIAMLAGALPTSAIDRFLPSAEARCDR